MKEAKFLQVAVAAVIGACSLFIAIVLVYVGDLGPPAFALAEINEVVATSEIPAPHLAGDAGVEIIVQPGL